ncbi:unnamed protein product [Orchesella dallaii]|uniref:Uncharacterized protein n=1 Tax=Orchesella dallaii TaxID=48710 RepID=A0ABP1PQ75_9HEXA
MLSPVTFRYLLLCQNLMWWGGGTPFNLILYQTKREVLLKPIIAASPGRKVNHVFSICMNVIYVIFVANRLTIKLQETEKTESSFNHIMQLSYVLTCYVVSVLLNIQTILNGDTIPFFIAEYFKFFKRIQGTYASK